MKKVLLYSGFIFLAVSLLSSCEDESPDNDSVIEKIEGQWKVEETNTLKSTDGADTYYVYIAPHRTDTTKVVITKFYNLGTTAEAVANVNGRTLTLPRQSLPGGFTILSGTGNISSNYRQITWSYAIDDGSGIADNVTAVYTPSY
jgi:hypothetical protein